MNKHPKLSRRRRRKLRKERQREAAIARRVEKALLRGDDVDVGLWAYDYTTGKTVRVG